MGYYGIHLWIEWTHSSSQNMCYQLALRYNTHTHNRCRLFAQESCILLTSGCLLAGLNEMEHIHVSKQNVKSSEESMSIEFPSPNIRTDRRRLGISALNFREYQRITFTWVRYVAEQHYRKSIFHLGFLHGIKTWRGTSPTNFISIFNSVESFVSRSQRQLRRALAHLPITSNCLLFKCLKRNHKQTISITVANLMMPTGMRDRQVDYQRIEKEWKRARNNSQSQIVSSVWW